MSYRLTTYHHPDAGGCPEATPTDRLTTDTTHTTTEEAKRTAHAEHEGALQWEAPDLQPTPVVAIARTHSGYWLIVEEQS